MNIPIQKPFLKWVGGKTQILDEIIELIPKEMDNYHELFLGGGSVLFAVLSLQKEKKIVIKNKIFAYDFNADLINVFKHIQNNFQSVQKYLNDLKSEYNSIEMLKLCKTKSKESFYYSIRDKFNNFPDKQSIEYSALFIFLNKTCFRGMHRRGPKGFNVPFGHYKQINFMDDIEIENISKLIENVEFIHADFQTSIIKIKKKDFVYMDPPYYPIDKKSFVSYNKDGFNLKMHDTLFELCNEKLKKKKIKFLFSNAKVDYVEKSFQDCKIKEIYARRAINRNNPGEKVKEILIYNF